MPSQTLLELLPERPRVAAVLGSGLGAFAECLQERRTVPYGEIPGMPQSSVAGHAGRFVFGTLDDEPLLLMQGRVHLYEGWTAKQTVTGIELMLEAGAKALLVTNAAGGIRADLLEGAQLMLIEDHINLTGQNCLVGANDSAVGPRFPDMSSAYCPSLRQIARQVAVEQGIELARGVYAGVLGPSYETPAEIRMLKAIGADAVGMSTVQEVIAANHRGVPCLGISCITNAAAGLAPGPLSHEDVQEAAQQSQATFARLLENLLPRVAKALDEPE